MVVLFHSGHGLGTWMPRFSYLAVDLFFLLSGFVLATKYEPRFQRGLTTSEFFIARVVRLYPLYLLGLILGACLARFGPDIRGLTAEGSAVGFLFGLAGLPSHVLHHGGSYIFALNPPFWSLFFEFWVANVIFVLFRNALNWQALAALILVSGLGLVVSEKLGYGDDVGFVWNTFAPGFARVGFSFFFGVAIARIYKTRPPKLHLPSWLFVVALPVMLSLPLNGPLATRYELACVFLLFPAMIYWGAGAIERRPAIGALLGDASYALYTIHYPLLALFCWLLLKFGIEPSLTMQFLFLLMAAALASGLSAADRHASSMLTAWIRPWQCRLAQRRSAGASAENAG